jgi:hypothetical protein
MVVNQVLNVVHLNFLNPNHDVSFAVMLQALSDSEEFYQEEEHLSVGVEVQKLEGNQGNQIENQSVLQVVCDDALEVFSWHGGVTWSEFFEEVKDHIHKENRFNYVRYQHDFS